MTNESTHDTSLAALNAVIGDRLAAQQSPLAIEMALYDHGRPLAALPNQTSKICVLVHGMGCTERCWDFPEDPEVDYGRRLEQEHGLTPLYVRYNTGLPIWENARRLAALLESITENAPTPVEEITLIGHSLGGLVIRGACHQGAEHAWVKRVRRAFYIGTPHLGSPLEQAGQWVAAAMKAIDEPVMQLLGDIAELRSAAVKNLRRGDLVESGEPIPLDGRIEHYFVAGEGIGGLLGDGLVPVHSATGAPRSDREPNDSSREETVGLFPDLHHMALAHHPDVYAWISERMGEPQAGTTHQPIVSTQDQAEHLDALFALLAEAVDEGSSAVQRVHEQIAARPYDVLEAVPVLRAPARAVRGVHFAVLRGSYSAVRVANALLRRAGKPGS